MLDRRKSGQPNERAAKGWGALFGACARAQDSDGNSLRLQAGRLLPARLTRGRWGCRVGGGGETHQPCRSTSCCRGARCRDRADGLHDSPRPRRPPPTPPRQAHPQQPSSSQEQRGQPLGSAVPARVSVLTGPSSGTPVAAMCRARAGATEGVLGPPRAAGPHPSCLTASRWQRARQPRPA